MEGLGRGILRRLAETSAQDTQHHLNNRDLSGQTVLGASILGGCSLQYIRFLIECGSHVDPKPLMPLPFTPLQAAAMSGSLDIVCLLLDNGAEVDRVWPGNPTPLTLAENAGHPEVVQRLSNTIIGHPSPQIFSLDWSPG
jgi:ankyrin repeat protein